LSCGALLRCLLLALEPALLFHLLLLCVARCLLCGRRLLLALGSALLLHLLLLRLVAWLLPGGRCSLLLSLRLVLLLYLLTRLPLLSLLLDGGLRLLRS